MKEEPPSAGPTVNRPAKKFPWIVYAIILLIILVVALAPIGSVLVAGALANSHGCQLDEGSSHPCMIGGQDHGELLYTLLVMGWLMLLTLPVGAIAGASSLVVLLLHRARWRRERGVDASQA